MNATCDALDQGVLCRMPLVNPLNTDSLNDAEQHPPEVMLQLLSMIEGDSRQTHRSLSRQLGVALGLTNTYLRRCVKKGWVKVTRAPSSRYAYYLTPHGFAEKSRLTAEFLRQGLSLMSAARRQYDDLFATCRSQGWTQVALWGHDELAEIAIIATDRHGLNLTALVAPGQSGRKILHVPVLDSVPPGVNALVVATLANPQQAYDLACAQMAPGRVLFPPLLHISKNVPVAEDELEVGNP